MGFTIARFQPEIDRSIRSVKAFCQAEYFSLKSLDGCKSWSCDRNPKNAGSYC